jgi:hypothetical protein
MKKPFPGDLWGRRFQTQYEYVFIVQSIEYSPFAFDIICIWDSKIRNLNIRIPSGLWFYCE